MKSYYVTYSTGSGEYFHKRTDAMKAYNSPIPGVTPTTYPESLECQTLTEDAFERAYHGQGGFVVDSTEIHRRNNFAQGTGPKTKLALKRQSNIICHL